MTAPAKLNFKVYQGSTFSEDLRWEANTKVYKPITNITNTAPLVVTAPAHGVPIGWRVKFTNIGGMTDLNSQDTYHQVTGTTTDTITINAVNAIGYKTYTTGGIVEYNLPVDLTGYTARMQIRGKLEDTTVIHQLTTENGGIVINNSLKTINLTIPALTTTGFTFTSAVYSLELVTADNKVLPFANGTLTLVKEVTR
jgi:hypothetical protein